MKTRQNFSAIILAGGVGKRMQSDRSKILHKIAGVTLIEKTVRVLESLKPSEIIIVGNKDNANKLQDIFKSKIKIAIQEKPLGTADAARIGLTKISAKINHIAILYGDDTAFYKKETVEKVFKKHIASKAKITFVTLHKKNPGGLGRIVRKNAKLIGIVEEKDAPQDVKKITEVNDGLYFFQKDFLSENIKYLSASPVTGELYITDLIGLALKNKQKVETYLLENGHEWHGINTPIELATANFKSNKKVHFMGIAGSGASAVANIAKAHGFDVTGCDIESSPYLKNIQIKNGHSPTHIKKISALIVSPAILKSTNYSEEIETAKKEGIPVVTWQEFLGNVLQEDKFVISVCGAYGKSTTTAMVSQILVDQKKDPTCELGAKVINWQTNYKIGNSKYFICEADEYNNNFLNYHPDIIVLLNIEWDHPDFFKSKEELKKSYITFIDNIKENGILILEKSTYKKIKDHVRSDVKIEFIKHFSKLSLSIIGDFRQENANAALTLSNALGLNYKQAVNTVTKFKGLSRRLEFKGKIDGVIFYDDYAVQPYTIKTTANALKEKYKTKKLALVWEPHTFSRVNTFLSSFIHEIKNTNIDQLFITDVFGAREKGDSSGVSKKLAQKIGSKAIYTGSVKNTAKYVRRYLKRYNVVCSMGAGDVYKLYGFVKNG